MSYSRRSRYSASPSPYRRYSRSVSRSLSRSPSRDVENPGNNLYVTGLSPRITKRDLEKHFSTEGEVIDVQLVADPWTRESRGFGFITMSSLAEADRCIKYLNRSVLEGRVITVEKAKRRRGRTPTPGRYMGLRTIRGKLRRNTPSYSPCRSPSYPSYRRSRSGSRYSSERSRSRSYSPYYRGRLRSYSPYYYSRRHRSYSQSQSPYSRRDSRYDSPVDRYYRRHWHDSDSYSPPRRSRRSARSYSRSISPSPRRGYSVSLSPSPRRSYSRSPSPRVRKSSSSRSRRAMASPRRSYSRSPSPRVRKSSSSRSRRAMASPKREPSYSRSPSASPSSRSGSRSGSPSS
ncbi:serine/arginine-rich splicing factor SR45a isoform X2 [Mercurialis annua]|uniref:serine/arginine-rich splicing factor SR45a isoform X2 n=1 Tax=Mercurialis annua TaxID=3986 RepID=UPI002160D646|nr:serine/arginine-rich splicing factor SR45a isoform X2 [Mercurialis annua]